MPAFVKGCQHAVCKVTSERDKSLPSSTNWIADKNNGRITEIIAKFPAFKYDKCVGISSVLITCVCMHQILF